MDADRGHFSHLRSVDRLGSAIGTVAAGEYGGIGRLHIFVDDNAALFVDLDTGDVLKKGASSVGRSP